MKVEISFFYGSFILNTDKDLTKFDKAKSIEQLENENFYSIFLGRKTFKYMIDKTEYKDTFTNVEIRFMLDENNKRTLKPYFINLYKGKRIEESFLFEVGVI